MKINFNVKQNSIDNFIEALKRMENSDVMFYSLRKYGEKNGVILFVDNGGVVDFYEEGCPEYYKSMEELILSVKNWQSYNMVFKKVLFNEFEMRAND